MKLAFITENTLQDLKVNFKVYLNHYYNNKGWFDKYLSENGRLIESNIDFEMPDLSFDEDYAISDRENVKAVYSALSHLPVAVATQERIWTGLAHNQFQEYTFYRLKKDLIEKKDNRIFSALFFKHGTKRSLFVHIISRLWWVGYMTYDHTNKENPFWLTDFFTERDFSARSVVFFSSNFTSNREITMGILRAIYKIKESGLLIKREYFLQATKYLNVLGGAMVLDMLTADEVEVMVMKNLKETFALELNEMVKI